MQFLVVLVSVLSCIVTPGLCIDCYRCNSTGTLDCLEKFMKPNPLRPEPCTDVADARFCIKATGVYDWHIGTKRFCSSVEMGDFCEYVTVDGREYRACIYTCYTDGCNGSASHFGSLVARLVCVAILLVSWKVALS